MVHFVSRVAKLVIIPLFLLQLLLFVFITQHRFVDTDEGYYLLASRLVLMHKRPYVDLFFFFSSKRRCCLTFTRCGSSCFHVTWSWARLLLLRSSQRCLGCCCTKYVCRQTRQWLAGVAAT